ncbi:MAG: hypothetical protein ACXWXM_09435 [Actinomycetota bacterium]
MTERLRGLDDDALGRALKATARQIDWPPSPDLAGRVTGELLDRERHPSLARPRLSLPHRRRTLLLVVAGVVLLAAAAVAAKVVIDLGALTIDTIPGRPTALPSAIASGPTVGHPATIGEAEQEAGFAAKVPGSLGAPDQVWVDSAQDGTRIVLGWSEDDALPAIDGLPWGALLYEFHGQMEQASKGVFMDGNTFESVDVGGQDGIWITGEHELDVVTHEGTYARYRVTDNVLVWDAGGIVLRLETSLDRVAAIRIAVSIPA